MKKLFLLTSAMLAVVVMGFGVKAIAVSPEKNPVAEKVTASMKEGEDALKNADSGSAAGEESSGNSAVPSGAPVKSNEVVFSPIEAENAGDITAIGDSVMLGAAGALQKAIDGITVDAKESRQLRAAQSIVRSMKENKSLGDTVVIALGTNGPFNEKTGQALLDEIGPDRHIYWVLAYGENLSWQQDVNSTINELANNNSNVRLIDWPAAATAHPDWLYGDGIHLNPDGQKGYAKMIQDAIQ